MVERVTIASLQAQLATVTAAAAEAQEAATAHRTRADNAEERLEAAMKRAREAEEFAGRLQGDIRTLQGSLRAYKGSATKARNEVLVLEREKSPVSRPIGALAEPRGTEEEVSRARYVARVRFEDALRDGPLELVFSDGKKEIRELAPLTIGGDAWRADARGYTLKPEGHPLIEPGDMTRPEVKIAGFGLLDEAGEQFAWAPLVEPIAVPRNGLVQLPAGTIRFSF